MRCAELLVMGAVVVAAGAAVAVEPRARPGEQTAPPRLDESALESGVRIVVVTPAAGVSPEVVEVVIALPVGWADDAAPPGRGLARLMADYATQALAGTKQNEPSEPPKPHEPPASPEPHEPFGVQLEPTATFFHGSVKVEQLETALAALVQRLTPAGVDGARFDEIAKSRSAAPVPATALDRFRQAAYPTTVGGLGAAGRLAAAKRLTKSDLETFLAARCGSEGSVVVLVSGAAPSTLALAAGRALATLPRARGVAPNVDPELVAVRPRRVDAPPGGSESCIGYRFDWCEDPLADRLELARAWLEVTASREAVLAERQRQGALVAFLGGSGESLETLTRTLGEGVAKLSGGESLSSAAFRALLERMDGGVAAAAAAPDSLAMMVARDVLATGDPLASFGRRARLEKGGSGAASEALRSLLRVDSRIEVVAVAGR